MSIFGSDRPSGSMGGLLSGLFRSVGGGPSAPSVDGTVARSGGSRKLVTGALLAAGAAYLYNRNRNKGVSTPNFTSGN